MAACIDLGHKVCGTAIKLLEIVVHKKKPPGL